MVGKVIWRPSIVNPESEYIGRNEVCIGSERMDPEWISIEPLRKL
jgi:hypothetical protein